MGDIMLLARSLMQREEDAPPAFHDYWMRDMAHANSDSCSLAKHAPGRDASKAAFFPGCQLGAAAPDIVKKTYDRLLEINPDTGLILNCCGAVAMWAGHESSFDEALQTVKRAWTELGRPTLILACPSCRRVFSKHLSEIETIPLYSVLADNGVSGEADAATFDIFDPCAAHADNEVKESVRRLLTASGCEVREIPEAAAGNGCCGFGGLIYPANPELYDEIVSHRLSAFDAPVVTYCVNCRDILRRNGKPCRHVLELVFPSGDGDDPLIAPSLTQRHESREALRKNMLASLWGEGAGDSIESSEPALEFAEGIRDKMDRLLLLEAEVAGIIDSCKRNGGVLRDNDTGQYCGHGVVGRVTCWVVWRETESGYHVENVYSHRMSISRIVNDRNDKRR
jgi:hypothetical protein